MNILLLEDSPRKSEKIINFFKLRNPNYAITLKKSLHSGLVEIDKSHNIYSLLLLDMTMPNYDEDDDGAPEPFAGREILSQMKFRKIQIPVIVITQFESFGKEDKMSINELDHQLNDKFSPVYLGAVYYSSAKDDWEDKLNNLLSNAGI